MFETYRVLAEEVLEKPSTKLEKLILEGNRINDESLRPLTRVLEYNNTLKFLDLSKNQIREQGANDLGQMISNNNSLLVLFLHWNKLQPRGG